MYAYLAPIAIGGALLLNGHCDALAQERPDDVLNIEQLRMQASNRPVLVDSLRVSYDVFQEPASHQPNGHIPHLFRNVLVDAATGRFSMDRSMAVEVPGKNGETQAATEVVTLTFDGDVQAAFLPDHMIGLVQEGADVNGLVESGLWGMMLLGEPQPDGLGIDDASLESLLAHGTIRDQIEFVADAPCHVVDAFYEGVRYATIWLDVERDLLPMKRVGYGSDGGVSSTVTVDSVRFLEDERVWLPETWQTEIQVRDETLRTFTVVEHEFVEFNPPVIDEDFRPHFPPGTIVTDQIAGMAYRVSDSGDIGKILYERFDDEWVTVVEPISTENASQDEPSSPLRRGERQPRRTKAPVFGSLAELMEFARAQAAKQPEHTERDAAVEATSPGVATEDHAPNSKHPVRMAPTATAPVTVKPLDASRGLHPMESPESGEADTARARSFRSLWPWALGATVIAVLLGIRYSSRSRRPA